MMILTPVERQLAVHGGQARNAAQHGTNNRKSPKSDLRINIEGYAGEIAFCNMTDSPLDLDFTTREYPDQDTTLPCGLTVDVKTTDYPTPDLLVPTTQQDTTVNLFALVLGVFREGFAGFDLLGYARPRDVMIPEYLDDMGYGETYRYPKRLLRPLDELYILDTPITHIEQEHRNGC